MSKKIVVIQDGIKECGSACLLSIIRYYDGNIPMPELIKLTNTTKDGTTFYDIKEAAYEIGLSVKGYKVENASKLYELTKPFISQVIINNYLHFVVIYKIDNDMVTIMDPAKGMVKMSLTEYLNIYTGNILLFEPFKELPKYNESSYIKSVIKSVINSNKYLIINLISLTIISIIFTCLYSCYLKIIIDNYLLESNFKILIITIIFIIIYLIKVISEYLRNNLLIYLNKKIDLTIITSIMRKIILLPYSYYKNKTTGEMISRINDLLYLKNIITKLITTIFIDIFLSLLIILILFKINTSMTLILLLITIIYYLIFISYKKIIEKYTKNIQISSARTNSLLTESISSYETIKGLSLEESFIKRINKRYESMINNNLLLNKNLNLENLLKNLFEGIIIIFILYRGFTSVINNNLSLGSLITYNTLILYFLTPIKNTLDFYKEFYYIKNSLIRINNLINYKYESLDTKQNINIHGNIHITNLNYSYNNHHSILNNLTLDIKEGSKVLILGSSGSGKSTILKLLYRYYEISKNMIFINNKDLLNYDIADIRNSITYVSQNEYLYTDTIKNNIILDRNILESKFITICKLLYIDDFVKDKPLAYNYIVEENGANLSGGERQRIILARALLKESNYIFVDEGLNEIDINLERKILKNIFLYYRNKTIIIISHRTDNMDLFDNVIYLEKGNIINNIRRRN